METTMLLLNYIDRTVLQRIQDSFASAVGITAVVVDPLGKPLTTPSAWVAARHPAIPPAAVMIFTADACLGKLVIGNTPRKAALPDIHSLVFMPLETDGKTVGALGFDRGTVRDWTPEAMAHFRTLAGELARELAEKRDRKTAREEWMLPVRPVYGRPAHLRA